MSSATSHRPGNLAPPPQRKTPPNPEPPPPGLVPSCAEAEGGVLGILPGTIGFIRATEEVLS
jgi:hypothetical protein